MPISVPRKSQKLVLVLTTSTMVTEDSEEAILISAKELEQVMYIQYYIAFLGGVN